MIESDIQFRKLMRTIWLALVVGLGLRVLFLLEFSQSPLFLSPSVDALYHLDWADKIAHGSLFPVTGEPYFRAPLYPMLLGVMQLCGLSTLTIAYIQVLISCVTIVLISLITWRLFSLKAALFAAWIAAVYFPIATYQIEFQLPVLTVPLFLLTIDRLIMAMKTTTKRNLAICSLTIGAFALVNPNALVLLIPLIWVAWKSLHSTGRRVMNMVVVMSWMIVVAPITLLNYLESKQFTLIATQGGVNLYLGNHSKADGAYAVHPELGADWEWGDAKRWIAKGEDISDTHADQLYRERVFQFWISDFRTALALTIRKMGYVFNHFEIGNNRDLQRFWRDFKVTNWLGAEWMYGVIAPIGVAGMLVFWRDRNKRWIALAGLLYALSFVPFFITARYRLPFVALLIVFAGGLLAYVHELRSEYWRKWKQLSVALAVGVFVVWLPKSAPAIHASHYSYTKGNAYLRLNRLIEAIPEYERVLSIEPKHGDAFGNLGYCYQQTGNLLGAENCFRNAIQNSNWKKQKAKWLNAIGVFYEMTRRYVEARENYRLAIMDDYHPDALENLVGLPYRIVKDAIAHNDFKAAVSFIEQANSENESAYACAVIKISHAAVTCEQTEAAIKIKQAILEVDSIEQIKQTVHESENNNLLGAMDVTISSQKSYSQIEKKRLSEFIAGVRQKITF